MVAIAGMSTAVVIEIPIKLQSWANARGHWRVLKSAKDREKAALTYAWIEAGKPIPEFPAVITCTRYGPRILDDDNLVSSFKYVRDQFYREIGLVCGDGTPRFNKKGRLIQPRAKDDGDEIRWRYRQVKWPEYRSRLVIEERK